MATEVFRLLDGAEYGTSPRSSGRDLYLVKGLHPDTCCGAEAIAQGLPERFKRHPANPGLYVTDVRLYEAIGNTDCLVEVPYVPVDYSGLVTDFGSREYGVPSPPFILPIVSQSGQAGPGYIIQVRYQEVMRDKMVRIEKRLVSDIDSTRSVLDFNYGKWYTFSAGPGTGSGNIQIPYLLASSPTYRLPNNQCFVETTFIRTGPVRGYSNFFAGQILDIPELGSLDEYDVPPFTGITTAPPPIVRRRYQDLYEEGDILPWL